jgi:hypothetical protein
METEIIAYCGITCSGCDAYQATQAQDRDELERVAAVWREEYDPSITAETILCDGCLVDDGPLCSYCSECPIRACAREKSVTSCAHCPDYGCEAIEGFMDHAPALRQVLETMRAEHLGGATSS